LLRASCFSLDPNAPDEAQQLAPDRNDDLPLLLAAIAIFM
jgi:hypothetical protein